MKNDNKRILVLTSVYPGPATPKGYTPVVHYFTKEWVDLGFDVRVIYASTYFPKIYYMAPQWLRRKVQDRIGIALPDIQRSEDLEYDYENVKVKRIAIKKFVPMAGFSERELLRACRKAHDYICEQDFQPDVIISHWVNPQMKLMSYLKKKTGAFTTMVLHETGHSIKKDYKDWRMLYDDVDAWGYRSLSIKEQFENAFGVPRFSFRCFSGIPASFCEGAPVKDGSFHNRYVQVGILMDRKYPHKTIEGVVRAYRGQDFKLELVGDGGMMESLKTQVLEAGLQNKVHLCGRIQREKVVEKMDNADVFILISREEVFGLVYIEAMARGCIVIASRGEGMEGIIEDGVNGFFCDAGNSEELESVINKIRSMNNLERADISAKAKETALMLTDKKVAKDYIDTVLQYKKARDESELKSPIYHAMAVIGGGQKNEHQRVVHLYDATP